jgi:hypothetical protein
MCTFFNRRCCFFRSKNSDALLYLKLWYSIYIRVEYQRLHENNLAQRRQLLCSICPRPTDRTVGKLKTSAFFMWY